jgi:hypothetical protein
MSRQAEVIHPHYPECRYPLGRGNAGGWDPMKCGYCAALVRQDYAASGLSLGLSSARPGEDPLSFRYRAS